jgi:hypothetical protein
MSILAADLRGRASGPSTRRAPGRRVLVVADPRAFAGGGSRRRTLQRRKVVLQVLAAATALAAVTAAVLGGPFVTLLIGLVLALLAYVGGLVWLRLNAQQVRRTVHRLPARRLPAHTEDDAQQLPLAAGHG